MSIKKPPIGGMVLFEDLRMCWALVSAKAVHKGIHSSNAWTRAAQIPQEGAKEAFHGVSPYKIG